MVFPVLLFLAVYVTGQLKGAPTFVDDPASSETIYVASEEDVIVVCSTQNPANITWQGGRGNSTVVYGPGNAELNVTQVTDRKSVLYVRSSEAKGTLVDGEPFLCRARDRATDQERTTSSFRFIQGFIPSISRQSPTSIQIPVGRSVELFCAILMRKARPHVSATWTFQKAPVQSNLTNPITDENEQRFILKVAGDKTSNGTYQCRLRNHFGAATSKPIDVIVTYLANMTISVDPQSLQVVENNDVRISAHVDSNPAPYNISLSKNGILKTLVSNRKTLDYTFKAERGDTGSFMMKSAHVSGHVNGTFYLTVFSPPSDVTFHVLNVTHNLVLYNWSVGMDGNTNVTGAKLCCGKNPNSARKGPCAVSANSQQMDVPPSSGTLFGLLPNRTYYCKIFVANRVGVTAGEFPKMIRTKSTVPSKPNMTGCISEEETSITVMWTLSNGGSEIRQYIVLYRSVEDVSTWENQTVTDGITQTGGNTTLTKLTQLTKYDVEIVAVNSVGRSSVARGQCSTTCDLSAPLELSDTRAVLADGRALRLYVDDRCGDVVGFTSVLCTGKHLQTTFSPITSHTFWVNVTGLKHHQHCVMTKATTDREINSSYAIFDSTHLRDSGDGMSISILVSVAVLATCLIATIMLEFLCKRRRRDQKKKANHQKGKTLAVNAVEKAIPMQESRAYDILPFSSLKDPSS